jgi:hypothetical protein
MGTMLARYGTMIYILKLKRLWNQESCFWSVLTQSRLCLPVDPEGEITPEATDITGKYGTANYGNWEAAIFVSWRIVFNAPYSCLFFLSSHLIEFFLPLHIAV